VIPSVRTLHSRFAEAKNLVGRLINCCKALGKMSLQDAITCVNAINAIT
jgi:hypothetical protein